MEFIVLDKRDIHINFFSSPELIRLIGELNMGLYLMPIHPSVCHPSTFSNDFSDESILPIFHI